MMFVFLLVIWILMFIPTWAHLLLFLTNLDYNTYAEEWEVEFWKKWCLSNLKKGLVWSMAHVVVFYLLLRAAEGWT